MYLQMIVLKLSIPLYKGLIARVILARWCMSAEFSTIVDDQKRVSFDCVFDGWIKWSRSFISGFWSSERIANTHFQSWKNLETASSWLFGWSIAVFSVPALHAMFGNRSEKHITACATSARAPANSCCRHTSLQQSATKRTFRMLLFQLHWIWTVISIRT